MAEEFKKHIKNYEENNLKNAADVFKVVSTKVIAESKDLESKLMTTKFEAENIELEARAERRAHY